MKLFCLKAAAVSVDSLTTCPVLRPRGGVGISIGMGSFTCCPFALGRWRMRILLDKVNCLVIIKYD